MTGWLPEMLSNLVADLIAAVIIYRIGRAMLNHRVKIFVNVHIKEAIDERMVNKDKPSFYVNYYRRLVIDNLSSEPIYDMFVVYDDVGFGSPLVQRVTWTSQKFTADNGKQTDMIRAGHSAFGETFFDSGTMGIYFRYRTVRGRVYYVELLEASIGLRSRLNSIRHFLKVRHSKGYVQRRAERRLRMLGRRWNRQTKRLKRQTKRLAR